MLAREQSSSACSKPTEAGWAPIGRMTDIDFGIANIQVRSIFDSSKVGLTTGTVRRLGGREYALIRLPSGEMEPLPVMFPIAPIEV